MMRQMQDAGPRPARSEGGNASLLALAFATLVLAWPEPAAAYVGPGAGITMLAALWAVIAAIVFALGGLIWWPIRTMRRRRKQATSNVAATAGGDHARSE